MSYPYSFISCPCTDISPADENAGRKEDTEADEEEHTFDPRSARATYSLYPIEHLLYCEDCQQLRCPRCTVEEIVCWFCPSCLFEMPASVVKSEGGRCTRNCFDCPICFSPLGISSINPDPTLRSVHGPWILACSWCQWSTLSIGWQFEKNTGLHAQVANLCSEDRRETADNKSSETEVASTAGDERSDIVKPTFSRLRKFYKSQVPTSTSEALMSPSGGYNYNSPQSIARIMSLYTGRGWGKNEQSGSDRVREAINASEGLEPLAMRVDEETIAKMRDLGWRSRSSLAQQEQQRAPFIAELRPRQPLLRTKRSKRCRICRHILVKPEPKVQSTRYKIKLIALNYLPLFFLKPLQPFGQSPLKLDSLKPLTPSQFLLTLKNPLFDPVKITLATPSVTPGPHEHKITILCPDFDIGSNVDQWDEALSTSKETRMSKHLSLSKPEISGGDGGKVAEAGKVWDKGKNWTTVVLEVVCVDVHTTGGQKMRNEDVLEIPIFVRMEWESEAAGESSSGLSKAVAGKEKKELSYWLVLGVGRVGTLAS